MIASAVETKLCTPGISNRSPSSKQIAQMIIASRPTKVRLSISLCSLSREKARYVIEFGNLVRGQFLGIGGDCHLETVGSDIGTRFPRPNIEGILRLPLNVLARDDIAARIG